MGWAKMAKSQNGVEQLALRKRLIVPFSFLEPRMAIQFVGRKSMVVLRTKSREVSLHNILLNIRPQMESGLLAYSVDKRGYVLIMMRNSFVEVRYIPSTIRTLIKNEVEGELSFKISVVVDIDN